MEEERCYTLVTLDRAGLQNHGGHRISWGRSKFEAGRKQNRKSVKGASLSLAHAHRLLGCSKQDRWSFPSWCWREGGSQNLPCDCAHLEALGRQGREKGRQWKRREPRFSCPQVKGAESSSLTPHLFSLPWSLGAWSDQG